MSEPDTTEVLELTAHDLQSTLAAKLRRHLNTRLHKLRLKNDTDLDPNATATVRGEIRALKNLSNLLALVKRDPAMVADEEPSE